MYMMKKTAFITKDFTELFNFPLQLPHGTHGGWPHPLQYPVSSQHVWKTTCRLWPCSEKTWVKIQDPLHFIFQFYLWARGVLRSDRTTRGEPLYRILTIRKNVRRCEWHKRRWQKTCQPHRFMHFFAICIILPSNPDLESWIDMHPLAVFSSSRISVAT
jgi:hypothetical protein